MEPTASKGPSRPTRRTNRHRAFVDAIEAANGEWVEIPLEGLPSGAQTGAYAELGRRRIEVQITDGVVYGRLRTDTP